MNKKGLTSQQVEVNREKYGTNALSIKESQSVWEMFIDSFKDPWIMILAFAFVVKCVLNIYSTISGVGDVNWFETIGIVIAIILSTGVGTYSSYKNEQDYNALQAESSKIISKVYRDGKLKEIMIDDIVKDDLVLLQAGDKIPVDGIIISGNAKVDQAALTGESEEVKKEELGDNELPQEDKNTSPTYNKYKVFRGSTVMSGELVIKATELGDNTLLGSINTSLQEESIKSPSAEKLEKLAKNIGILGYSGAGLYTVIRLIQELFINKTSGVGLFSTVVEIIMYAITIIIMAVPEGLPMMLALVSSMNGRRLSKQHILVRHSDSIETAGYINKLFSDKTGTITEGKLSVVDFILGNGIVDKFENLNIKQEIINGIGLNNDSNVVDDEKGNKHASGSNNTDRALLDFLIKTDNLDFDSSAVISKEEFNSANKFASVTLKDGTKYIKGAPEFILTDIKYYLDKNGEVKEFSTSIKDKFEKASVEQATRAMRILAIIKEVNNEKTLIAGVCIRDNVREGISNTVNVLNKAGVDVVMVTGDRKETAVAIAKEAGIINSDEDVVLTHEELDNLSDNEVKGLLSKLKVVARALPNDKKRLVKLSQQLNLVVGMTGM